MARPARLTVAKDYVPADVEDSSQGVEAST